MGYACLSAFLSLPPSQLCFIERISAMSSVSPFCALMGKRDLPNQPRFPKSWSLVQTFTSTSPTSPAGSFRFAPNHELSHVPGRPAAWQKPQFLGNANSFGVPGSCRELNKSWLSSIHYPRTAVKKGHCYPKHGIKRYTLKESTHTAIISSHSNEA